MAATGVDKSRRRAGTSRRPERRPRSYLYSMGEREQIASHGSAVADWNEAVPAISLGAQAQAAKKASAAARGTPRVVHTITVTDGIAMPAHEIAYQPRNIALGGNDERAIASACLLLLAAVTRPCRA